MNKMDQWREAKARAKSTRDFATRCHKDSCDKFGATVELSATYQGSYGSSSVHRWSEAEITNVTKEIIQVGFRHFANLAANRAERELEHCRLEATDEAHEILEDLTDDK